MTNIKKLALLLPLIISSPREGEDPLIQDENAYHFIIGNLLGDLSLHKSAKDKGDTDNTFKKGFFVFDQGSMDLAAFFRYKAGQHGLLPLTKKSETMTIKAHKDRGRNDPKAFWEKFDNLTKKVASIEEQVYSSVELYNSSDKKVNNYADQFKGFGKKIEDQKKNLDRQKDYDLSFSFATRTYNAKNWEDAFYTIRPEKKNRSKKVPENIHELFTSPYALAMWFLGDGWKAPDCRNIHFAGGEWTLEEVERMQKCLLNNFGLHTTTVGSKESEHTHRFTVIEKSYDKFCDYVNPYIDELIEFVGPSIYNDKYFKTKLLR